MPLEPRSGRQREAAHEFAALLGANIGSKLTPIGSPLYETLLILQRYVESHWQRFSLESSMPSAHNFRRVLFVWLVRAAALRRCHHTIFLAAFASSFLSARGDDKPQERTTAAIAVACV